LEIEDNSLLNEIGHQGDIGWYNFLLGQTARHFEAIQQDYISRQWNSASFWAMNLLLALWEFGWRIWKYSMTARVWTGYPKESSMTMWHKNGRMETSTSLLKINP
jgi:hypothetical protein